MTNVTITAQTLDDAFNSSGITGVYSGDVTGSSSNYGYTANGASNGVNDDIYKGSSGKGGLRFRAGTATGYWNTTNNAKGARYFAAACSNLEAVVLYGMFTYSGCYIYDFVMFCPKLKTVYLQNVGGNAFDMRDFANGAMTDDSLYGQDTSVTMKNVAYSASYEGLLFTRAFEGCSYLRRCTLYQVGNGHGGSSPGSGGSFVRMFAVCSALTQVSLNYVGYQSHYNKDAGTHYVYGSDFATLGPL